MELSTKESAGQGSVSLKAAEKEGCDSVNPREAILYLLIQTGLNIFIGDSRWNERSMHIHRIRKVLKVIELFDGHEALTGVSSAGKPQALSCKASISKQSSFNEKASKWTSHTEGRNVGQEAPSHIFE